MKSLFDQVSFDCSRNVTKSYSTSFSSAVKMLAPNIRQDIYNIYGFVRFADEIVDSFHDFNKEELLLLFENDLELSLKNKISLNPILNAFQNTVHQYDIPKELIDAFMKSMKLDLSKTEYKTISEYNEYIYGSADVVGLMCLKVFVKGDDTKYELLKDSAMRLGSAFQKVNFLRDIRADYQGLSRVYFPGCDFSNFTQADKSAIEKDILEDFRAAYAGIQQLPLKARFGVYVAYKYYLSLFKKIRGLEPASVLQARIRIPNIQKAYIVLRAGVKNQLRLI